MKSQKSLVVGDDRLGHAVVAHERERVPPVRRRPLVVVAAVGGRALERRDPGAGAARDRRSQARVVEMVVRDEHELDVLDAEADAGEARLERCQRLVLARARVDERHGVAAQQPGVHRADVRKRERGCGWMLSMT